MSERLPEYIDPLRLAETGQVVTGCLAPAQMPRLASLLANTQGTVDVVLEFGRSGRIRFVHGRIDAQLQVICQRCLQPMDLELALEPKLGLVHSAQQAESLPDDYEPLLAGEHIRLVDIIEDELILGLPIVARHAGADCAGQLTSLGPAPEAARKNPFSILKSLKNSN